MREALYYQPHETGVKCLLCPKYCIIGEGQSGFCRARETQGGRLFSLNYAACSSCALDPIEKKPLYHFYPGSQILSLGTWGCNFTCRFCQNWQIAQEKPNTHSLLPVEAVKLAGQQAGNIGIAYTYSEPVVWYEFILDTARLLREAGMKNVVVTNGFINPEPLRELLPYIDALNIDVKSFRDDFYRRICAGSLADVKRTVELAAEVCHVEVTTLLIPGLNDSQEEVRDLAQWLAQVNNQIPLHLSRYFPNYQLQDRQPTPLTVMQAAYETAKQHVEYVYLGNMGAQFVNTLCPVCKNIVIDRVYMQSFLQHDHTCCCCGNHIPIVGTITALKS